MPSRSNPNTPSSLKRKTASKLQYKRRSNQRQARNKIAKPSPRTSQALRQAAPLSKKKTRKMEKKIGFARRRKMEEMGEVEMKDVGDVDKKKGGREARKEEGTNDEDMELDVVE